MKARALACVLFLLLTGCSGQDSAAAQREAELEAARGAGYDQGYEEGRQTGYAEGYKAGLAEVPQAAAAQTDVQPSAPEEPRETETAAPAEAAATIQGEQESQGTVYVTKSGTKYHREGCSYLSGGRTALGLADAKNQGYTPCSRCKPPS